jgi:GT2 family glycosyltransferase
MSKASGNLLLLLNSDTELEDSSLSEVFDAFAREPELGIAGAALHHPNGSPQWSGGRMPTSLWYFALASGIPAFLGKLRAWRRLRSPSGSGGGTVDWVAGTAMVIRRQVWEEVGPFDLSYQFYCQDLELCSKAVAAGWRIRVLPGFKVYHHHGATISNARGAVGPTHPELMWTDFLRFVRRQKGNAAARSSTRAMRIGGTLRLVGRRIASPWIPESERSDWQAETSAYAAALRALDHANEPSRHPLP